MKLIIGLILLSIIIILFVKSLYNPTKDYIISEEWLYTKEMERRKGNIIL